MIEDIIEISQYYGKNPNYTIAGGGNSSYKSDTTLWIKASGHAMGSIGKDGFVAMDIPKLQTLWDKQYPKDRQAREAQFLEDIGNARMPGEQARPSVETLLHQLFPYSFVIHTHPTMVNGVGCASSGQQLIKDLFGGSVYWVPSMDPGYHLAITLRKMLEKEPRIPHLLLLQNHGLFVAANFKQEIYSLHDQLMKRLSEDLFEDFDCGQINPEIPETADRDLLKAAFPSEYEVVQLTGDGVTDLVDSRETFSKIETPLTPDQIVYAGPQLLWVDQWSDLEERVSEYKKIWGKLPQVLGVHARGIYILGAKGKSLETAATITAESIKSFRYAEQIGGIHALSSDEILFIHNWEAEHYRSKVHKEEK